MFGIAKNKDLVEIAARLRRVEQGVKILETDVLELRCPHRTVTSKKYNWESEYTITGDYGFSSCAHCGKIIKSYKTKKEWLEAQRDHINAELGFLSKTYVDPYKKQATDGFNAVTHTG